MKNNLQSILLFLSLLLLSGILQAQPNTRVNESFKNILGTDTLVQQPFLGGLLNKETWIIRSKDKDTLEIAEVKNGKLHGEQQLFYHNGDVKSIAHYKHGLLDGKVEVFIQNSKQLIALMHYKALPDSGVSVLHGEVERYFHGKGIQERLNYKEGKKDGPYTQYFQNGQLQTKGQYKEDLEIGRKLSYSQSGDLQREENFIIIDNPQYLALNKNQKQKLEEVKPVNTRNIAQKISVLHGTVKYYRNGKLTSDCQYKNGKKDGLCKEYHYNSNELKSEVEYKDGKKHGTFTHYFANGKINSKGIFYETIKADSQVYNNVYDGEIVYFQEKRNNDGEKVIYKNRIETWENYKKNGIAEFYSYHSGKLNKRIRYKDNLQTGLEERFDADGTKNYEGHFEIVIKDGKRVSQQTGIEKSWKDGELRYTTEWKNGKKNGVSKMYYENGNLEKVMHFTDGELDGKYQTYYENGQIKEDYDYFYNSKRRQKFHIGWNKTYNKEGQLKHIFHSYGNGENSIGIQYKNGKQSTFSVDKAIFIETSVAKKIKSIHYLNHSRPYFGYDFFRNQQLRKVHFNATDFHSASANFNSKGEVIQIYSATGNNIEDKEIKNIAKQVGENYNPAWNKEALITEGFKNGTYKWNYADGTPFFEISFKDSLPNGVWLMYNPINGDTIYHKEYKLGKPVGEWIEKTIDGVYKQKTTYFSNHKIKENHRYQQNGNLRETKKYDSLGQLTYQADYFENGNLKYWRNSQTNSHAYYRKNGDTSSYNILLTDGDSIQLERQFYENNQVKVERRYNLTTGLGEVKTYFENGQLKTLHESKNKLTHGIYKQLDEDGNLLTLGHFKNKKRHGQWIQYNKDGTTKVSQFKNGRIVIEKLKEKDNTDNCHCIDTTLQSGSIGYAGSLSYFEEYENIKDFIPKSIVPIDSFNYDKIFYVGLQTDNNRSAGFTSLKLLLFKDFAFHYPAPGFLKFNLTPCKTEGYISNIKGNFHYRYSTDRTLHAHLSTKTIGVSLNNNPLVDQNKKPYTIHFETKGMDVSENDIKYIDFIDEDSTCYPLGIINNLMKIEIQKAELDIRPSNGRFSDVPLLPAEVKQFYGFDIRQATLKFDFIKDGKTIKISAKAQRILAGSNYVAGKIILEGQLKENNTFTLENKQHTFPIDEIKKFLETKGFYRVEINEVVEGISIQFYTEK